MALQLLKTAPTAWHSGSTVAPRAATHTCSRESVRHVNSVSTMSTHPLDYGKTHFSDLDDGSEHPDVADGGKSEDDGPEDRQREDEQGREDPVQPQLGLTEQDERQSPQRVKPMSRVRLGQHVREVELEIGK